MLPGAFDPDKFLHGSITYYNLKKADKLTDAVSPFIHTHVLGIIEDSLWQVGATLGGDPLRDHGEYRSLSI